MTSLFECVEMTRPIAVVSKNTAGSNSAGLAVLRSVFLLERFDLSARDITASPPFRRELNCLSATDAWHRAAVGDAQVYASGRKRVQANPQDRRSTRNWFTIA